MIEIERKYLFVKENIETIPFTYSSCEDIFQYYDNHFRYRSVDLHTEPQKCYRTKKNFTTTFGNLFISDEQEENISGELFAPSGKILSKRRLYLDVVYNNHTFKCTLDDYYNFDLLKLESELLVPGSLASYSDESVVEGFCNGVWKDKLLSCSIAKVTVGGVSGIIIPYVFSDKQLYNLL